MNYLDFDLAIEALPGTPGTYRARVLYSPAGQATVDFTLPFNAHELENYILKMGRPRRKVRSLTDEGKAARELGARLYDAVFQGEVRDVLRGSLLKADDETGLRLRLRLGDAPDLLDLPWEYLYDPSLRRFFCHSVATPLVRYPEQPRPVTPLTVTLPLQVLVMIANPSDVNALDVEEEWRKIQEALAPLAAQGQVQLTRLPNATLSALQRQLRQGRYHIFHFVGHGGVSPTTGERVLYLEDERSRARAVNGDYLGPLLSDHRSLRLALLNACEGARVGLNDPFAGVAQHLVLQGIPAIIAMQFEISNQTALILAQEFYSALADGYSLEAALAEARKAIFVAGHEVEWGTPVLYSRASDGYLFKLTPIEREPPEYEAAKTGSPANASNTVTNLPGRGERDLQNKETPAALSRKMDIAPTTLGELPSDLDDLVQISAKNLIGYDFRIGKYPVTNYQFRRFIEVQGYTDDQWWQDEDGRRFRDQGKWLNPRYWNNAKFNQPAQPVVGISWYEASAYCAWLTVHWRALGKIRRDERIRLPTQAEWIAAARSGHSAPDNRSEDYPWRGPFDPAVANTRESNTGQTTPVNKYPNGCTRNGVWDMSGNAGEWILDHTSNGYCVKGGAWYDDAKGAMVSVVIDWLTRADRSNAYGCRVVVVPNLSLIDFVKIA